MREGMGVYSNCSRKYIQITRGINNNSNSSSGIIPKTIKEEANGYSIGLFNNYSPTNRVNKSIHNKNIYSKRANYQMRMNQIQIQIAITIVLLFLLYSSTIITHSFSSKPTTIITIIILIIATTIVVIRRWNWMSISPLFLWHLNIKANSITKITRSLDTPIPSNKTINKREKRVDGPILP